VHWLNPKCLRSILTACIMGISSAVTPRALSANLPGGWNDHRFASDWPAWRLFHSETWLGRGR
jgi:hypothetical protein